MALETIREEKIAVEIKWPDLEGWTEILLLSYIWCEILHFWAVDYLNVALS